MDFIITENKIYLNNQSNDKIIAEVTFKKISDSTVDINHTYVDTSLRGQGIASKLMLETVNYLKQQNLTAIATCSYAKKWFENNEEYKYILK